MHETGVVVGDSCMVPLLKKYASDRCAESVGRGAFFIHPETEGLENYLVDGEHWRTWKANDWRGLKNLIDYYLLPENKEERKRIATAGQKHVIENHTYRNRIQQIISTLQSDGALK
jgi:spore maturation protein CgeB